MSGKWYETHENMVGLASALDDAACFPETADVIRFFEKPWKWTTEWENWVKAGKPAQFVDDPSDTSGEAKP